MVLSQGKLFFQILTDLFLVNLIPNTLFPDFYIAPAVKAIT